LHISYAYNAIFLYPCQYPLKIGQKGTFGPFYQVIKTGKFI